MKRLISNTMATTGLTLVILAVIATLYQARFLYISSVFESLLANFLIHLGLMFAQKFESRFFFLEMLVEISYVLIVLIIAGFLFDWYSSTPIWIVILMGVGIYFISSLINVIRINEDIAFINRELRKQKEQ
jgi:hypothetical protein